MINWIIPSDKQPELFNFLFKLKDKKEIKEYVNDIKYTYNLDLQIYTQDSLKVNPSNMMNMFTTNENNISKPHIFLIIDIFITAITTKCYAKITKKILVLD